MQHLILEGQKILVDIKMEIKISNRLNSISSYAFADVDNEAAKLKKLGIVPIDFGVGDPKEPAPEIVRSAVKKAVDERKSSGYPSYIGAEEYRQEISKWCKKRFGVNLDYGSEITSTIGAKEAVFNFPEAFINPGDYAIMSNPGYPPYERGTLFAEGKPYFVPLLKENNFLMDLSSIPKDIIKKSKILWINYPNNPTGAVATEKFFKQAIDFGHDNNIIVASDECYTEIYFDEKPHSILEYSKEGVVSFQSLSKRSAMTCYRIGWVAGDENIISAFKKLKTNIDSGTAAFIQDAAIAALKDTRFPGFNGEKVDYKNKTGKKLPLEKEPISVTVIKIGKKFIVDPDTEEEKVIDSRLTVASIEDGTLCALQKGGDMPLSHDDISRMLDIGMEKAKELRKNL